MILAPNHQILNILYSFHPLKSDFLNLYSKKWAEQE